MLMSHDFSRSVLTKGRSMMAAALLAASTAIVPAGTALAQETEIVAVMHSGLRVLDPIITTAHITRNHGYMIYDVLLGQDENFAPQPQMAEFTVSDDGLTYTFTLRDGLVFHDGAPVTAADAVASLERWGKRDSGGQLIFDVTESLEATDDKTITWTLASPFGPLLDIISKQSAVPPFIMPARVAATSADEAITEYIGSGPFIFVESAFEPGVSVVYEKFDGYVPRDEPASWMAGGKVVNVDRVRWTAMPDAQTAVNALASGEIDEHYQVPREHSWMIAAMEMGIPVYTPGWEDSTTGNMFAANVLTGKVPHHQCVKSGTEQFAHLIEWYLANNGEAGGTPSVGFFQIGGGIAGDFAICAVPSIIQDMQQPDTPFWGYFCQITDAEVSYGGYSGAVPNEKITWGKLDADTPKFLVKSDATIVAPLIFGYLLGD